MQRRDKIFGIIMSRSGASLIFVLGIMLLLMAIGTSALVAASAAAGTGISRQAASQRNLYAESIHKSIMHNLQASNSASDPSQTMGGQLLTVIYDEVRALPASEAIEVDASILSYHYPPSPDGSIPTGDRDHFTITIEDNGVSVTSRAGGVALEKFNDIDRYTKEIEISVEMLNIDITKNHMAPSREVDEDGVPTPPVPISRKAEINNAQIRVTVTIVDEHQERSLISSATYFCRYGLLEQNTITGLMDITDAGEWELVSHEKVDSYIKNSSGGA